MSELIDRIFAAGIVGGGGAGFPAHVKFGGGAQRLILNGAECEPLLHTDRYIMAHAADRVIRAASALRRELGGISCTVALKEAYREETASLRAAIAAVDSEIELYPLHGFYPAGDEQVIVAEVTGRAVPPAGIPLDVGCVVSNVATMLCVCDAMDGKPFTQKILSVNGLVASPGVIRVPVGTSLSDCVRLCGGAVSEEFIAVSGGPMMGKRMTREQFLQAHVTKTTSGILLLPQSGPIARSQNVSVEQMKNRIRSACIHCSYCTQLCPRNLLGHPLEPHKIMQKIAFIDDSTQLLNDPDIRRAALCSECGLCEIYACPMGLQPRRVNAMLKGELSKAGIRYKKGEGQTEISPFRESRRVPAKRVAARLGVLEFYDVDWQDHLLEYTPQSVTISLHQSIGAPSEPIVSDGQYVCRDELIAMCPENKLGANLHASIAGKVTVRTDSIVIDKEEKQNA